MKGQIDIERCRRGMAQVDICGTPRPALIEEAIARIQTDPVGALSKEYLAIKNYAGFGDQREDHSYGHSPAYGHVVFSIGRASALLGRGAALDGDAIYLLEAYRDFGTVEWEDRAETDRYNRRRQLSLCAAIRRADALALERQPIIDALAQRFVESHELVGA
jgi:hypothetical protein